MDEENQEVDRLEVWNGRLEPTEQTPGERYQPIALVKTFQNKVSHAYVSPNTSIPV